MTGGTVFEFETSNGRFLTNQVQGPGLVVLSQARGRSIRAHLLSTADLELAAGPSVLRGDSSCMVPVCTGVYTFGIPNNRGTSRMGSFVEAHLLQSLIRELFSV
jgi:hypothetical protein